jgi:hypothetical protein
MTEGSNKSEENDAPEEPHLPLTVDSPIYWAECLVDHDALRDFYKEHGVHCFDCCATEVETFAEGARVHEGGPYGGFDPEKIVEGLNEIAQKHPFDESTYVERTLFRRVVDMLFG